MSRTRASFNKLRLFLLLLLFFFIVFCLWSTRELLHMKQSIESGWFDTPTKYYTSPLEFRKGQIISTQETLSLLKKAGLNERGLDQSLGPKQFTLIPYFDCENRLAPRKINRETRSCIVVQNRADKTSILEFTNTTLLNITKISDGKSFETNSLITAPILFAQWSMGKPALRTQVNLSQIPRYCIDGVLAIEDDRFLNHQGVSLKGILRAAIVNFKSGRMSQGGSTLTQQLIKNKYLTAEKSLVRKGKEAIMAVLIELLLDKDEILQAYLNYIYWGQRGPYTVYGIEEASKHYFDKSVHQLGLAECSLLAAAIKGPGIYGPHRKEKSKKRQLKVLNRMRELKLITAGEFDEALDKYVRVFNKSKNKLLAPYYINSIQTWLKNENKKEEGLSIYTELDFFAQRALEKKLDQYLDGRSQGFEGSYILANNNTNSIIALASGKSNSLNYNSAISAKRHIGSLAKPFVYLNAFLENDESDEFIITPTTPLNNSSVTYKYEGQTWKPQNYDKKDSSIEYPVYLALAQSKNIPTIQLLKITGHKSLHKLMLKYGFEKPIPLVPSIALGGFEQSPLNVLRAYINLSTGNEYDSKPEFVSKIYNSKGSLLYDRSYSDFDLNLKSEERIVLEMLKKTLLFGTARRTQSMNLKGVYAGKTGTTNEHRDAWFASTSLDYTSITWVGRADYLTDKGRKLTGSGAALPIWMTITEELEKSGRYSHDWPISDDLYSEEVPFPGNPDITTPLLFKQ